MDLTTDIRYIKGVGEKAAAKQAWPFTIGDLISYFPRAYQDRTEIKDFRT